MGIARFFLWLKNQFGQDIQELTRDQTFSDISLEIDNFMIDLNGVFHGSAQKIYEYGNNKPKTRLLSHPKKQSSTGGGLKKQIKVFEDVCATIERLFKLVKPKQRLILCVDGPAPQSKQNQQRQRRYRKTTDGEKCEFDSCSITPGTKFMDYLTKYIDWYIRKRISEDDDWQNIQVIFSNEKAEGEGEYKCMQYIRNYGDENETYCLHGMDADLVMLSLGTHVENFYILRDELYKQAVEFLVVNIGKIRHDLDSLLKWEGDSYNPECAINDFIFMCFVVGNDFLPHIPSIEIMEGGIDTMIDVYRQVCKEYGHLTSKTKSGIFFNKDILGIFLGTVSQHEKKMFETKLSRKDNFFPDNLLEKHAVFKGQDGYDLNLDEYKKEYYSTHFPKDEPLEKICHDYMEGMQWVMNYYTKGVPNWNWYFPYHYAPFASDIAKYSKEYQQPVYRESSAVTPYQQLLSVLPPSSSQLLPPPLCNLLTEKSSPLKKFYPDVFDIDVAGKKNEWEGVVILPMVKFDDVRSAYFSVLGSVDKQELKRNIAGKSFVYVYNNEEIFTFRSYYGDIEKCRATIESLDL